MSILIKGMEMPKCPVLFCIHPDGKVFADYEGNWCEYKAVHVPEHGRCIDADALMDEAYQPGAYGYVDAIQIENAPTVIPADEVV